MAGKTLTIDLSEEYKIKIEEPSNLNGSFFEDIYIDAAEAVRDIIEQTERNNKISDKELFYTEKQDYNNIIAFCGERGTGKSSAMITFAQSLIEIDKTNDFYKTSPKLALNKFESINVIDPSLFEEGENIFEVILAQLFSRFELELKDNAHQKDIDQKRKLLEQFEKVYENLQTIKKNGQKYDGEALETLSKLACGANLRNNFKELIKNYLKFISKEDNKKNETYLIIPIDDFDLNVNAVADMTEQIRKYLMIPQVIILMAANLEQLADAKELRIIKDLMVKLNKNSISEESNIISERYLAKLLPQDRRLFLPNIYIEGKTTKIKLSNAPEAKILEQFVLNEIYNKTSIILIEDKTEPHYIIPNTLRELIYLLKFLSELPKINPIHSKLFVKNTKQVLVNLNKFEDYLTSFWSKMYISKNYQKVLKEISELPYNQRNQFIISKVIEKYHNDFVNTRKGKAEDDQEALLKTKVSEKFSSDIEKILNKNNYPFNISLGDLLKFFDYINNVNNLKEDKMFFSAIKLKYSIWFLELLITNNEKEILNLSNSFLYYFDSLIIPRETSREREDSIFSQKARRQRDEYIQMRRREEISLLSRQHFKIEYSSIVNRKFKNTDLRKVDDISIELLHYFIINYGTEEYRRNNAKRFIPDYVDSIKKSKATWDILFPAFSQFYSQEISLYVKNTLNIKSDLVNKIVQWKKEGYWTFLPFYSVEILEIMIKQENIYNSSKYAGKTHSNTVKTFYDQIRQSFNNNININQNKECFQYILESFNNYPLIKLLNEESNSKISILNDVTIDPFRKIPKEVLENEISTFQKRINEAKITKVRGFKSALTRYFKLSFRQSTKEIIDSDFYFFISELNSTKISDSYLEAVIEFEKDVDVTIKNAEKFIQQLPSDFKERIYMAKDIDTSNMTLIDVIDILDFLKDNTSLNESLILDCHSYLINVSQIIINKLLESFLNNYE